MNKSKLRLIEPLPKLLREKLKEYDAYREEEAAKAAAKKKAAKKSK